MRPAPLLFLLLICQIMSVAQTAPPIGQWREHLPYHQSISIEAINNKIWSATPYSIFSVDPIDNTIERLSKINGLTETGIRTIGKDAEGNRLIIVYNSGNIDILSANGIGNIPDIFSSQLIVDKKINQVYAAAGQSWLAGNEAIYAVNTVKNEIQNTYIIGTGGKKINIYSLAVFKGSLYAATQEGLKYAILSGPNLSDFRNWKTDTSPGIPAGPVNDVIALDDKLIMRSGDSIFASIVNGWSFFYTDGWTIHSIQMSGNKILVNQTLNNNARVLVLNNSGAVEKTITNGFITKPVESLILDNEYWVADSLKGLSVLSGIIPTNIAPESPADVAVGDMRISSQQLVTVGGDVTTGWEPLNKPGLISILLEKGWVNYQPANLSALNTFPDIVAAEIDPIDKSIWAGSYGGGLMHLGNDGIAQVFKTNSFIREAYFSPGSYRVSGLQFDGENNLWISNYGADQNLVVKKPDGASRSFKVPFPVTESAVADIVIDDLNQKWIIAPKGNGLICFNHGSSIDNTGDDLWKWYRNGQGNGNLPSANVLSIARDKDGFIWVGTSKGIAIIRCIQEVFTNAGCEAFLPIVQQDNFAGYLFSDEEVQAIAVDGANRKWIGTKNGLWLLSADGEKILYRFSASNSPLPADDVKQISLDPVTGEVFIATSMGISSFRSTATEPAPTSKNVLVFPNPVPPSYTGTIAIRGLANNAIVKITELNGNLVFQTRALGGQAVWNGKDYKGRQISTGVYLVLISDESTKEQVAAKIVYIKK
ncbi:type IX secretion system anionic LPS delivery protein PorZ [Flavitalea sp.]|nr:two-component regulator propeller domain-containing protein [Flavitalea sp.]